MSDSDRWKLLEECVAREAIRQVLALYCRAIDRGDEDLIRQLYWPEATDTHGSFEGGLDEFIAWAFPQLGTLEASHHQIGNPCIALEGSTAEVETYWTAYKRVKPAPGAQDHVTGGRYIDRMEARAGEWRIIKRIATYDWFTTVPNYPWESFGSSWKPELIARRKPDDTVYGLQSARVDAAGGHRHRRGDFR